MAHFHILQHVDFEYPGYILDWLQDKQHAVSYTRFYDDTFLPDVSVLDALIVMGGPMSAYDDDKYEWLKTEKSFIKECIARKKKVLGICLGSQILASVLGARVYPNAHKEIGFMPIKFKKSALFGNVDEQTVFHWHGDTYDLPVGAELLASTDVTPNQAFIYKEHVLALQFHMEVTPVLLEAMINNGKNELKEGKYIQTDTEIREKSTFIPDCNKRMEILLNNFFGK